MAESLPHKNKMAVESPALSSRSRRHAIGATFVATRAPLSLSKKGTSSSTSQEENGVNVLKVLKTATWALVTARVFGPSILRASETLVFCGDALVGSDILLAGLAVGTCPIGKVKEAAFGTDLKAAVIGWLAAAVAGALSAFQRRQRLNSVAKQAVLLEGQESIWRSTLAEEKGALVATREDTVTTLYENFFAYSAVKYPTAKCLGARTAEGFAWETYEETAEKASEFGSGLRALGLKPGDKLGIYSINNPQWVLAELGGYTQSIVNVALYSTLGQEAVQYVVSHSEMVAAVCNLKNLGGILEVAPKCPKLKTVIFMDADKSAPTDAQVGAAKAAGVTLIAFSDVRGKGVASPHPHEPPKPTDIATVMYTSGTTGNPKGVILTHQNILAVGAATGIMLASQGVKLSTEDRYLSYLPLAHIFERSAMSSMLFGGVAIGFFGGDVQKLIEDIGALKPTVLVGVPRVFTRVYDRVMAKVASGTKTKQFLFNTAIKETKHVRAAGGAFGSTPLWDKIVYKKVKAALGGACRVIVSGGAPLSADAQSFFSTVFGCPCIQGYGLTETSAGGCMGLFDDPSSGHVGPPLPSHDLKLESVPDMNYSTADKPFPRGEICFRGYDVMQGYYKEPEMTKEVIDANGWFHTGDIGQINENGTLTIIDRKKNIFKLAQGEYVAAEKLETLYQKANLVGQVFVYGDSFQTVLVAIVVPDPDALKKWAVETAQIPEADVNALSFKDLCALPGAAKAVQEELVRVGKEAKMNGFEIVKSVHLESEAFSVENDTMTPTFKLKRPQLKAKYQTVISDLYAKLGSR